MTIYPALSGTPARVASSSIPRWTHRLPAPMIEAFQANIRMLRSTYEDMQTADIHDRVVREIETRAS
jgi:hypothetical protein